MLLRGTPLGLTRFFRVPVLGRLGNAYVEIIRGLPLIVQLSMVYFGRTPFGVVLPALGNEYVSLILGSSLASVVTLQELFAQAGQINGATYRYFEVFAVTAAIYFALTFSLTRVIRALERRLSRGQTVESAGPRRVI